MRILSCIDSPSSYGIYGVRSLWFQLSLSCQAWAIAECPPGNSTLRLQQRPITSWFWNQDAMEHVREKASRYIKMHKVILCWCTVLYAMLYQIWRDYCWIAVAGCPAILLFSTTKKIQKGQQLWPIRLLVFWAKVQVSDGHVILSWHRQIWRVFHQGHPEVGLKGKISEWNKPYWIPWWTSQNEQNGHERSMSVCLKICLKMKINGVAASIGSFWLVLLFKGHIVAGYFGINPPYFQTHPY